MRNFKKKAKRQDVPRFIAIISTRLNMKFQPIKGSSFYKRPAKDRIIKGQEEWNSPVGTLRLSDHWNYFNQAEKLVGQTDIFVPPKMWALSVNTGRALKAWKVLKVFECKVNVIRDIDFISIQKEIEIALTLYSYNEGNEAGHKCDRANLV